MEKEDDKIKDKELYAVYERYHESAFKALKYYSGALDRLYIENAHDMRLWEFVSGLVA